MTKIITRKEQIAEENTMSTPLNETINPMEALGFSSEEEAIAAINAMVDTICKEKNTESIVSICKAINTLEQHYTKREIAIFAIQSHERYKRMRHILNNPLRGVLELAAMMTKDMKEDDDDLAG
jgi:predicted P-loop ATPase/GTPase